MGQRSSDARDAMAEMAERAQLISQEAGTKIAAAMKDVIGAAAGIAGFAVESARDLVQYMVRRGQITQDEADKLIRQAEDAHGRHGRSGASKGAAGERAAPKPERPSREFAREESKPVASAAKRASGATAASKPEKKQPAKRPAAKKSAPKPSAPKKKR